MIGIFMSLLAYRFRKILLEMMNLFVFLICQGIICLRFGRLQNIFFEKLVVIIIRLHIIVEILQSVIGISLFDRFNVRNIDLIQGLLRPLQRRSHLFGTLNRSRGALDFHSRNEHAT